MGKKKKKKYWQVGIRWGGRTRWIPKKYRYKRTALASARQNRRWLKRKYGRTLGRIIIKKR